MLKKPDKQNQIRQLSSCPIPKYNGFQVIAIDFAKSERRKFTPIDIIYKPTRDPEIMPLCYYTTDISKAYASLYSTTNSKLKQAYAVHQCYYCQKFFVKKNKLERHI